MADHANMDSDIRPPSPHGKTYTFDDFIAEEEAHRQEQRAKSVDDKKDGE